MERRFNERTTTMSRRSRWTGTQRSIALLAALIMGCSRMPTAPELSAVESDPVMTAQSPAKPLPADPAVDRSQQPPSQPDSLDPTVFFNGNDGATVSAGRVTLVIPPDAVHGNATLTLAVPSATSLECRVSISPASKGSFAVPATLSFDMSGRKFAPHAAVFWWNAARGNWRQLPSDLDAESMLIRASLDELSNCRVGTAQWDTHTE